MGATLKALNWLIRALATVLVISVVGAVLLFISLRWSQSNKEQASYECTLRRMDHKISDADTEVYHDTCMASLGYKRLNSCISGYLIAAPPYCFASNWQLWR